MKRTNENLAEWLLMIYMLRTLNVYENKPRYRKLKKHHLDGIEVHREIIEPYRQTLKSFIDACEITEQTGVLPIQEVSSITDTYDLIDLIVRDKIII